MSWNDYLLLLMPLAGQSLMHYALGFFVGLSGYALTQTMYYGAFKIFRLTASLTMGQRRFMVYSGLCFALVLAWCSHIYLDSVHHWWITPIDPPLVINTDPGRYNP